MFRSGQQIGTYNLVQKLGRGAFGEVWLAERRAKFVTTKVAVKLPLEESVDSDAIKQEATLWEKASGHPNVLPIIDADEYDGQVVIVSEYAPDGSLENLLKDKGGSLPTKQSVEIAIGILSGLEFLHSRKIIHRDIKPANILLQGETPRLADFGISRVMKTNSLSVAATGTPYYMAPEAFDRKRNVQTDIWSVGVVLYQMLKGELPFKAENITDLLGAIINGEPEPLPHSVPQQLQRIVLKALTKEPANRYQSASEMRQDLADFLIRISQKDIQLTQVAIPDDLISGVKTLEKTDVMQIAETQPAFELQSENFVNLPKVEIKKSASYFKILIPIFAILFLLAGLTGGYWWLTNKGATQLSQISNSTNTKENIQSNQNSNSSPIVEDVKLIPFRKGNKWGFSDSAKKIIVEPKFEEVYTFTESLAGVKLNGRFGFIDQTGNFVIEPKYNGAKPFTEGFAPIANTKDEWGFIDKTGNIVIPPKYNDAGQFMGGLAGVTFDGKKGGFVDPSGKEVIPLKYKIGGFFGEGLVPIKEKGKWGFIDISENVVIPFKYDDAGYFSDGLAYVKVSSKYGFIDRAGKFVIPPKFDIAGKFTEGLAMVGTNDEYGVVGKTGFIDKTGNIVILLKYEDAWEFSDGLAPVKVGDKWGFIDKDGIVVITYKYDGAGRFQNGIAPVTFNGKEYFVGKDGTEYYEP